MTDYFRYVTLACLFSVATSTIALGLSFLCELTWKSIVRNAQELVTGDLLPFCCQFHSQRHHHGSTVVIGFDQFDRLDHV